MSDVEQTLRAPFRGGDRGEGGERRPMLIVIKGLDIGRRYLLNEERLVLGRRADKADLVVIGDPEISSAHCRFDRSAQFDAWVVTDLGSTNGTRVEGETVGTHELSDGDRLYVGRTVLKFCYLDELETDFHQRVDRYMNEDDLTGLPVLRVFQERFREAVGQSSVTRRPLAVLMMDMDGLKAINDAHGHQLGAHTISSVGRLLAEVIPAEGVVSRFGGDEFTAFLPGYDTAAGVEIAERARTRLASSVIELDGVTVRPTISIGVASFPTDGASAEELMRHADEALYRAKAAGRDRVST